MKVGSGVIHYKNHQDYINSKSLGKSAKEALKNTGLKESLGEATSTEISDKSKTLGEEAKDVVKKAGDEITKPLDKIKNKGKETGSLGKKLLGEAASTLTKAFKTPGVTNLGLPSFSSESKDISEIDSAKKIEMKSKTIHRPAIMFIGGFSINPFSDGMDGLKGMSAHLPSSEFYNWDEEDKIVEEILKRDMAQPVVLVGHGMGGDTAVGVTEKLNNLENGFRRVDLLMTLDSIGMDNDIIPQNVRKNVNIISDADYFFNDGPNVARNKEITNVVNELRPEPHADLETSTDVQFKVFEEVQDVLGLDTVDKILEFNRVKSRAGSKFKDILHKPSNNQTV
tara:strand:- start:74919 stop:75935 length:1017 start_codon:yes stop_codon:yes gene_type:complete